MGRRESIAKCGLLTSVAAAAVLLGAPAKADSLTPDSFSATIGVGGVTDITDKLGVISAGSPTTALADVMFIVDTTGSMSAGIAAVDSALEGTVAALAPLGSIATGAAQFKDKTGDGYDPFDYSLSQAITTNSALTQTALGAFTANGGGDTPEQGLFALSSATTDPATGWRAGAKKIEVIVGDAPSHDDAHPTAPAGTSVSSVAATLSSNGVTLITLDANPLTHGDDGIDHYGQFSGLLADGVSGPAVTGFTDSTAITDAIVAAVGSAFATYSTVSLGLVGAAPSNCSVSLPSAFTGSFDRSIDRPFSFGSVGVTGVSAGTCSFDIGLFADGVLLATESDTVTVTGTVPEPSTWATMLIGFAALGYMGYRRRAKAAFSSAA
jgi:PEP-CTERM motif